MSIPKEEKKKKKEKKVVDIETAKEEKKEEEIIEEKEKYLDENDLSRLIINRLRQDKLVSDGTALQLKNSNLNLKIAEMNKEMAANNAQFGGIQNQLKTFALERNSLILELSKKYKLEPGTWSYDDINGLIEIIPEEILEQHKKEQEEKQKAMELKREMLKKKIEESEK